MQLSETDQENQRLCRRLERERATRLQAEAIAEQGLRELYEKKRETELLVRIAAAANETNSVDQILHLALREVCQFINWQAGHACIVSCESGAECLISSRCWYAHDLGKINAFRKATEDSKFDPGSGLPGRVFQSCQPLWLDNVTEDDNFPRWKFAFECGLRSGTAFPVLSGNEVVAVLEFFSDTPRALSESQLDLMRQIGLQLGRVIERQRAEIALRAHTADLMKARDEAKAADLAKSAFLANMSHELRTPLNAIIGFSEFLETAHGSAVRYQEYAKDIHRSGIHLLGIINDVLDLAKMDVNAVQLNETPLDLGHLIKDCAVVLELQAEAKNLVVAIDPCAAPLQIAADDKRLRQILLNLLSNAVKFTGEGGSIFISYGASHHGVRVAVRDTGIGMRDEDIPCALQRFGQIDSSLSRKYEGTGLGLPLAKSLTELHGGTLTIESSVGVGTTVSVHLPASRILWPALPVRAAPSKPEVRLAASICRG